SKQPHVAVEPQRCCRDHLVPLLPRMTGHHLEIKPHTHFQRDSSEPIDARGRSPIWLHPWTSSKDWPFLGDRSAPLPQDLSRGGISFSTEYRGSPPHTRKMLRRVALLA